MLKFVKACFVFAVIVTAMSIGNSVALLSIHDFTYYYTIEGLKLAGAVCLVETVIVLLGVGPLFRWIMGDDEMIKMGLLRKKEE